MSEFNRKINYEELPGSIEKDKLISLVDWQAGRYFIENVQCTIAVISFEVHPDKVILHARDSIVKYMSACISRVINKTNDSYTFDGANFVILFPGRLSSFVSQQMQKIAKFLAGKYDSDVLLHVGISTCPDAGASYSELWQSALSELNVINSQPAVVQETSQQAFQSWRHEISKSLENIENSVKTQLFLELNNLVQVINNYDAYLGDHSALVAQGVIVFANELGMPWKEVERIAIAALLHDIGYTAIPKEIFNKNTSLSAEEWKIIQLHPTIACEHILKDISIFQEYLPLIQNHHEFLDGSGYPKRKKGEQIPIGAQIISIVDTYQAMKVDRPYRRAKKFEEMIDFYLKNAGIKWEEELVTIFMSIVVDDELSKKLDEKDDLTLSLVMQQNEK